MSNNDQIIGRFAEQAGTENPRFLQPASSNIRIGHSSTYGNRTPDTIYSYGTHFPMARIMPDGDNARGWWLVNSDRYSPSTGQHQSAVRSHLKTTGLPVLLVPFSALNRAGIDAATIKTVDTLPDRYTYEPRTRDEEPREYERDDRYHRNWQQLDDGRWSYEASVHHMGEALFTADFSYWHREPSHVDLVTMQRVYPEGETIRGSGYFLSAFDENEPNFGLYFLAQLPEGASPSTVAEAREALKPAEVTYAEREGREVLRQGDVFAIAHPELKTRDLAVPTELGAYVLGVNHKVSEVRVDFGKTYGRGFMRHAPHGRRAEHRRIKLGDGKTWFELVKNTVPEGRSWSVGGNVD